MSSDDSEASRNRMGTDDDELVAANSVLWSAAVLSPIVLAPLAGAVVVTLGARVAFGINSVTFLASAIALAGMSMPPAEPAPRLSRRAEIVDGIQITATAVCSERSRPSQPGYSVYQGRTEGRRIPLLRLSPDRTPRTAPVGLNLLRTSL